MQTSRWGAPKAAALTLVRVLPAAALSGLVVAVVAALALNYQQPEPTARVEVGISQAVTWPFFEVAVGSAEATAVELGSVVQDELGEDFIAYRVERVEGSLLFDIVVTATTGDLAMRGADLAFDEMVALLLASKSGSIQIELDVLGESLVVATAAAEAEEAAYVSALASRGSAETDLEVAQAKSASEGLATSRAALDREVVELQSELADAELVQALLVDDVRVVSRTSAEESESSNKRVAGAVGLGAGLLVALGLLSLERSHGRIRSAKQVESELGLRCLAAVNNGSVSTELERVIHLAGANGHRCVLIESAGGGGRSDSAVSDIMLPDSILNDPDMQLVRDPASQPQLLGSCSGAIVLAPKGNTTLRELKRQVSRHETSGLEVVGVVLT